MIFAKNNIQNVPMHISLFIVLVVAQKIFGAPIPNIQENCTFVRDVYVQNLGVVGYTDVEIFFEISQNVIEGKVRGDCLDSYLLDENLNYIPIFQDGVCSRYAFKASVEAGETKSYKFYYGCEIVNMTHRITFNGVWILLSKRSCPLPWTEFAPANGKFFRLSSEYGDSIFPAIPTHTHGVSSGTSERHYSNQYRDGYPNDVQTAQTSWHDHTYNSFTTGNSIGDLHPPATDFIVCSRTSYLNVFNESIILTSGVLSGQYKHFEGLSPYTYVKGGPNFGTTSGTESHHHQFSVTLNTRSISAYYDQFHDSDEDQPTIGPSHYHEVVNENTETGTNRLPEVAFSPVMSLQNNNEILDTHYFLSTSSIVPMGYQRLYKLDGLFLSLQSSVSFLETFKRSRYHTHDVNKNSNGPANGIVECRSGGGGSRFSTNHRHAIITTTNGHRMPFPPHLNVTLFQRLYNKANIISFYGTESIVGDEDSSGGEIICTPVCISGICVGPLPYHCLCDDGYSGDQCDTPVCTPSCGNNGACVGPNLCQCGQNWVDFNGTKCSFFEGQDLPPNYTGLYITLGIIGVLAIFAIIIVTIAIVIASTVYGVLSKRRKKSLGLMNKLNEQKEKLQQREEETRLFLLKKSELKDELERLKAEEDRLKKTRVVVIEIKPMDVKRNNEIVSTKSYNISSGKMGDEDVLITNFKKDLFESSKINAYKFLKNTFVHGSFNHPNILKNKAIFQYGVVSEHCPQTIESYLKSGKKFEFDEVVRILFEISAGGIFLHRKKVVLKKLSISNVFLTEKLKPKIEVGLTSKFMNENMKNLYYVAPELILRKRNKKDEDEEMDEEDEDEDEGENLRYRCDIFSFGMIMFSLLKNEPDPYRIKGKKNGIAMKIAQNEGYRPSLGRKIDAYPNWFVNLMRQCFRANPEERPSFSKIQLIISTILGQGDDGSDEEKEEKIEEKEEITPD